jgi:hypothetical protein
LGNMSRGQILRPAGSGTSSGWDHEKTLLLCWWGGKSVTVNNDGLAEEPASLLAKLLKKNRTVGGPDADGQR